MTIHREMRRRAYLIARLVPMGPYYELTEFRIYSERDPTDRVGTIHAVIASADAGDFQAAHDELVEFARRWYPPLAKQLEGE